jgi:hypothetical protein
VPPSARTRNVDGNIPNLIPPAAAVEPGAPRAYPTDNSMGDPVKKSLAVLVLPATLLAGCGTHTTPSAHAAMKAEPCGQTVKGLITGFHDPVQLNISRVLLGAHSVGADYRITENRPGETFSGYKAPSGYLTLNEKIVGYSRNVPATPTRPYPLDRGPYTASVAVNTLCPRTTWPSLKRPSNGYRFTVVLPRKAEKAWITSEPIMVSAATAATKVTR